MKVLLSGAGVDDSRSPAWLLVRQSLVGAGHRVFAFDIADAERLKMKKPASEQRSWIFETFKPDVCVLLPDGVGDDDFLEEATANNVRVVVLNVPELTVKLPGATDVNAGGNSEFMSRRSERTTPYFPHEVLVIGDETSERRETALQLLNDGFDLGFCGLGWDSELRFAGRAVSPVPGSYFAELLHTAKCVLVLPTTSGHSLSKFGPLNTSLAVANAGVALVAAGNCGVGNYLPAAVCEMDSISVEVSALLDSEELRRLRVALNAEAALAFDWKVRWADLLAPVPSTQIRVRKEGPKVSYLTAAYQIENYIGPSIESLLEQSFDDIEIIVSIDGGSDNSASVVRKYLGDPRVRMIEQPNIGQTGRFDWIFAPLDMYRGEFLALQGGDDLSHPERTQRSLDVFEGDPCVSIVHTGGILIDKESKAHGNTWEIDTSYDESSMLRREIKGNLVASPSMFVRRSLFDAVGFLSGGFATDYELWIRAARVARFRYIPEPLVSYRIHDTNASVGANRGNSVDAGLLTRLYERDRVSILDLYPALAYAGDDVEAWVAAYVDLGNGHMQHLVAPEAALREYDVALSMAPPGQLIDVIHHCRAIAFDKLGKTSRAAEARTLSALEGVAFDQLINAHAISTTPFQLPTEIARQTVCWDGTPVSQSRVLLIPDWNDIAGAWPFLDEYLRRCSADDEIDLVLPTLGFATSDVVQRLMSTLPNSLDLEKSADLTIERWDDMQFLPTERFSAVVNLLDGQGQAQKMENLKAGISTVRTAING